MLELVVDVDDRVVMGVEGAAVDVGGVRQLGDGDLVHGLLLEELEKGEVDVAPGALDSAVHVGASFLSDIC